MNRLHRISQLVQISSERSLTEAELDEWDRLQCWRRVRLHRLPRRLAACRSKMARLKRELAALS